MFKDWKLNHNLRKLSETQSSSETRIRAVHNLGKLGDRRAVGWLIETLSDKSPEVRKATIECLGKLGDKRAVEALFATVLGDGASNVRAAAVEVLGNLGDETVVGRLVPLLFDHNSQVRKATADALSKLGHPVWKQWIKDDNDDFRRLAESKDPKALQLLGSAAVYGGSKRVRMEAVRGLITFGSSDSVELLIESLRHEPEPEIREICIEALGNIGDSRAVEPLLHAYGNLGSDKAVIDAVGKLGDQRAAERLMKALVSSTKPGHSQVSHHADIRKAAANALSKLGHSKWQQFVKGDENDLDRLAASGDHELLIPFIISLRLNRSTEIASQALERIGTPSVEPLLEILEDWDRLQNRPAPLGHVVSSGVIHYWDEFAVVRNAVRILGNIGDPRAVKPLLKVGGEDAWKALGKIGDLQAVEPLIKVLFNPYDPYSLNVKDVVAIEVLGELGDNRAIEPLVKILGHRLDDLRRTAARALAKLGEPEWEKWVKGDEYDFKRLREEAGIKAIQPLITGLFGIQYKEAIEGLMTMGPQAVNKAVDRLIKVLRNDYCAARAMEILGELGDNRAIEPLVKILGHRLDDLRRTAARALAKLGEPEWEKWVKGDEYDFKRLREEAGITNGAISL